jgi:uncharacterized RDD family membrane protein YckC
MTQVVTARRAGFMSRLAAFAVDAIILAVVLRGTGWFLVATGKALRGLGHHLLDPIALTCTVLPLLAAIYLVFFWRSSGQTPGKWLMGLKVVRVGGGPVSLGRAALRFCGYLLSALPFYAGFLWILGPDRRAWHDRIAGTEVVYVRPRPIEGAQALARAPSS